MWGTSVVSKGIWMFESEGQLVAQSLLVDSAMTGCERALEASENGFMEADGVVSFHAELPASLQAAMAGFIERYPNWDQYRLIQAALAGFLVQNGVDSRPITRLYIGNMFCSNSFIQGSEA